MLSHSIHPYKVLRDGRVVFHASNWYLAMNVGYDLHKHEEEPKGFYEVKWGVHREPAKRVQAERKSTLDLV